MKNFLIISRSLELPYGDTVNRISDYLQKNGGTVVATLSDRDSALSDIEVDDNIDCILTLGGDGTLIRAAGRVSNYRVPFIGINAGHLGYLCEIDMDSIEESLDKLLSDDVKIDNRMMLECIDSDSCGKGKKVKALNDVVVSKGAGTLSVVNLTVLINGSKIFTYDCDGLVFATPTGSTAYNLSANGPIVNPTTSAIILTPLNPHTLNCRSIILDPDDRIEVILNPRRDDIEETASVFYDGNLGCVLRPGKSLLINKADVTTKMVHVKDDNFLDRIRNKMQETVV